MHLQFSRLFSTGKDDGGKTLLYSYWEGMRVQMFFLTRPIEFGVDISIQFYLHQPQIYHHTFFQHLSTGLHCTDSRCELLFMSRHFQPEWTVADLQRCVFLTFTSRSPMTLWHIFLGPQMTFCLCKQGAERWWVMMCGQESERMDIQNTQSLVAEQQKQTTFLTNWIPDRLGKVCGVK